VSARGGEVLLLVLAIPLPHHRCPTPTLWRLYAAETSVAAVCYLARRHIAVRCLLECKGIFRAGFGVPLMKNGTFHRWLVVMPQNTAIAAITSPIGPLMKHLLGPLRPLQGRTQSVRPKQDLD
jgi:hypothetical protein